MAIEKILTYDTELNEDIGYTVHPISLALGEANGHTIKVNVLRGGTKVTDSATCKGKFLRADGSTVEFNGTFSSGIASVTLPSSCYTKEGACKLSVYLVNGSQISCVFVLVANVLKYTSTEIVDTNQVVPNIETLLANVAKIEAIANDADAINKKIGHVEKSGNTILFYSDATKARLIASVDIPAGSGGGTAAPYDDTYLRNNKVGYAEFENGVLKMYNDATKSNLIRQVTIPTGSGGGGLTDAQVQTLIDNSLSTVNAGLSELQNKDKSTQTGKVWGTTSDGAGWVDAPEGGIGEGLSTEAKTALLACMEYVEWIDTEGLTRYNALATALGMPTKDGGDTPVTPPTDDPTPTKTLTGITVTWSATSADVGTDPRTLISSVKANYSDGTSQSVTGYTVSPASLVEGSQTVTVTYNGKTDTKTIIGTAVEQPEEPTDGWMYDPSKWVSGYTQNSYGFSVDANSATYARTYGYGMDDYYIPVPDGATGFDLNANNGILFNIVVYQYKDAKEQYQRKSDNGTANHHVEFAGLAGFTKFISVSINYASGTIANDELVFEFF